MRGEKFTYPKKYAPEVFFRSALFITPGEPEPIELLFSETTEPFIRLRRFHETQQTKTLADGRIKMTLTAPVNFETVNWVLSFGSHVRVVEPKGLRDRVVEELKRALRGYG
jgi:predicted DNA-binding transcriptional regulator YafY